MPRPTLETRSETRKTSAAWVAAAGLTLLAGVVLYLAAAPPPNSLVSPPAVPGAALASQPAPPALPIPETSRPAEYRARAAALRPLESALLRVFLGATPPRPARAAVRMARVTPARSPQACLAQAVYYEARGEPAEGQAAVAQVVLNRTRSGRHPADVCGAVFEGARRPGCQFSFACDSRLAGRPLETGAWRRAQGVAAEVMAGRGPPGLDDALNYHAESVHPRWAAQFQRTAEIGRHIFYASASAAHRALAGWVFAAPAPSSGA